MAQTKQLVAIMFTDIVGYSALMSNDDAKAYDLLDKNNLLQKRLIKKNGGKWIKDLGDGILASFSAVSNAVICACCIIEGTKSIDGLKLRIGIHLGEVLFQNDDVFGDGVNIAFRLQSIAPVNGIYISEAVRNTISNKREIKAIFIGKEILKHIKEPVGIYEVLVNSKDTLNRANTMSATDFENTTEKSIAVLPFVNMSSDPEQEYFSDGISEEILNYLSKIEGLKVVARTSSFYFKNRNEDVRSVGKQLDVNFILEGSVRKDKDLVRITAQLVNIKDGFHLWSERYDRKLNNIFFIQEEIADSVREKLKLTLSQIKVQGKTLEGASLAWFNGVRDLSTKVQPTYDVEAYEYYLKGRYFTHRFQFELAANAYHEAVNLDQGFTEAYFMLANTYCWLSNLWSLSPIEGYERAREMAQSVMLFNDDQALANIILGYTNLFYEWNLGLSEENFKTALAIDSNSVSAMAGLSLIFLAREDFTNSYAQIIKAISLEPFNTSLLYQKCMYHIFRYQYELAIETVQKIQYLDQHDILSNSLLSMAYIGLKDFEKSLELIERASEGEANFGVTKASFAVSLALTGNTGKAREILNKMLSETLNKDCSAFGIAFIYAALEDMDYAYDWLNRALNGRHSYFLIMFDRTFWDLVREDSRFNALQEKVTAMKIL